MGYDVRDINGAKQTGFALWQFTMRRGSRCSTAKAFLRPIRLRPNLHISMWSHATKVHIEPVTKRAYAVEFIRDGKKYIVKVGQYFIICQYLVDLNTFALSQGKMRERKLYMVA